MMALNLPQQSRSPVFDSQESFGGGLCQITGVFGSAGAWPGSAAACTRPDQALKLTNCRLLTSGAVAKRLGTYRTMAAGNILPVQASSGIFWNRTKYVVVACGASGLYYGDASAGNPSSYSSVATSAVSGTPVFAIFNDVGGVATDVLYQADSGGLHKWTGAAYSAPGSVPTVTGICVYNQRLWGWISGSSNALYYSNLSTAVGSIGGDSLGVGASSGGQINVQTFGLSNIITCIPIGSSLMIFQKDGVSRLTGFGQSDITVQPQPVSNAVLVVGPQAVAAESESVAYAVTVQGVYRVTEGGVQRLGTPDRPDPTIYPVFAAWSTGLTGGINAIYNPNTNEVWFDMNQTGTSGWEGTYIYHTVLGAWSGPWNGRYKSINGFVFNPGYLNAGGSVGLSPRMLLLDDLGYVVDTDYPTNLVDDMTNLFAGGTGYTQTIQCHRMFGQASGPVGPIGTGNVSKSWTHTNVLAALTSGGTQPTVLTTSLYGGGGTSQTFPTLVTGERTYYNAAGGSGPYVDVVITDTGSSPSQYVSVSVEGIVTGRR